MMSGQDPNAQDAAQPGFWEWLKSPQAMGIIGGVGQALGAKAENRNANILPVFTAGMQTAQASAQRQQLAQKLADPNFLNDPARRSQVASILISSGDPKMQELGIKLYESGQSKPVSVAAGSSLVDPNTGRVIYQGSGKSTSENRLIYNSLPSLEKEQLLAQAAGMGYDYQDANEQFNQGVSLKELAEKKGFKNAGEYPTPIYPTTKASMTQIQSRQQALTEMDSLGNTIKEWTEPYSRRFQGYSIPAMIDAFGGKNTDQLAKFLAAKGMSLDYAAIRTRALGAKVGEGVLNDMVESTMGKINFPTTLVGSDLYRKTQELVDKAIRQSVLKANKVGLQPGLANDDNPYGQDQAEDMVSITNSKTGATKMVTRAEAKRLGAL